ncbi:hypothetical protein IKG38_02710 [Candidatus Saccharibacteria bacterium]|nr:hypothetical protein [Candidatus Saccharibacteria bacterium]
MNQGPEFSNNQAGPNNEWDSLANESFGDFAGETNLNSKTGKPRTFTTFDVYPKMPGESNEEYGARLKFMQEKNAEYQAAEAAKEQALKEQQARDAYAQTEQGQQEAKVNAEFDRISDKLDQAVEEGRMSAEQAERLREKQFNQANEEIDGIRQDYQDRQSVGTPEEQANYQTWLQSHDAKNTENLNNRNANYSVVDENYDVIKDVILDDNQETDNSTSNKDTNNPTQDTENKPAKNTYETPWLQYDNEEERMRDEWQSMVGLDEYIQEKAQERDDSVKQYNADHEADMRKEWEEITGLDEYKKATEVSPDNKPDANDTEPTDKSAKKNRWKYSIVMGYDGRDKIINPDSASTDQGTEADPQDKNNEREKQLAEIAKERESIMSKMDAKFKELLARTTANIFKRTGDAQQASAEEDQKQTPEANPINDSPEDGTDATATSKETTGVPSEEERRENYLNFINDWSRIFEDKGVKILTEIGQRTPEEYQEFWDSMDPVTKHNAYRVLIEDLPGTPEGKGFRDWLRSADINPDEI